MINYRKKNLNRIKLISLILVIVLVTAFGILDKKPEGGKFSNFFYRISEPIQVKLLDSEGSFFERMLYCKDIEMKNEELEKEIQKLLAEMVYLRSLEEENNIFRKALGLKLNEEFSLVFAGVTAKDISTDSILINKGSKDGLSVGMPIVTEEKVLLGKIGVVFNDYSRVVLISNKDSSFPVEIQSNNLKAVIKGRGNFRAILEEIPLEGELFNGNNIVTCSLGGDFPKGLLVGRLRDAVKSDTSPFRKAEIDLFYSIDLTENVFVITNF